MVIKKYPLYTQVKFYFGNSPSFWMGLQMDYDLDIAEDTLVDKIKKEVSQQAAA